MLGGPKAKILPVTTPKVSPAEWQKAVDEAKTLFQVRNKKQMEIARLALEVCEIALGGNTKDGKYTLVRFAREVGVNRSCLSRWCTVRKLVYDRLPESQANKITYARLSHVATKVHSDTPKAVFDELVQDICYRNDIDTKFYKYLYSLRSFSNLFVKHNAALKVNKKILQETLFYSDIISRSIRSEHKEIKPTNHMIAGKNNTHNVSGINKVLSNGKANLKLKASSGEIVDISDRDKKLIHALKKKKSFFSPIELGEIAANSNNPQIVKSYVYDALKKLMNLDLVERNNKGHYRWKE